LGFTEKPANRSKKVFHRLFLNGGGGGEKNKLHNLGTDIKKTGGGGDEEKA